MLFALKSKALQSLVEQEGPRVGAAKLDDLRKRSIVYSHRFRVEGIRKRLDQRTKHGFGRGFGDLIIFRGRKLSELCDVAALVCPGRPIFTQELCDKLFG